MPDRSDRVRKLIALAADQEGTPEGETAARLARRLIRDGALPGATPTTLTRRRISIIRSSPWRTRLAASVAQHCACRAGWRPGQAHVFFFGHASDIDVAEYLLVVLMRQICQARDDWVAAAPTRRTSNDFCHSAVTALEHKLADMRGEESITDQAGTAMVRSRVCQVEEWMARTGVKLGPTSPSPHAHSPDGYAVGHGISLREGVGEPDDGPPARIPR